MGRARTAHRHLPALAVLLVLAGSFAAAPAVAQQPGHIQGIVYAANAAPLEGARVEAFPSMITSDSTARPSRAASIAEPKRL